MENYLPAIIIIGGILYNLYKNYTKEQQKALQRKENMPKPASFTDTPVESMKSKYKKSKIKNPLVASTTNIEHADMPEEVRRVREERARSHQPYKPASAIPTQAVPAPVEFDLRAAIIQSAILNRPYK